MSHDVQWYSPAPLWPHRLENGTRDRLRRPELLQFEQDDFMEELQETLDDPSSQFNESVHDGNGTQDGGGADDSGESTPLSLYHPANERYYLVTASLVCREHGLPDRAVDTTSDERVSFVLRRQVPEQSERGEGVREYGWFGEERGWYPIEPGDPALKRQVQENGTTQIIEETRLSMFPQNYDPETPQERMKNKRRLWAGLIPVAKREAYETAPIRREVGTGKPPNESANTGSQNTSAPTPDPRKPEFQARVIDPLKRMWDKLESGDGVSGKGVRDPLLFAWLELWQFLDRYLPDVAETIENQQEDSVDATDFREKGSQKVDLLDMLGSVDISNMELGNHPTDVLRKIARQATHLEAGELDRVLGPDELSDNLREDVERLLWGEGSGGIAFDDTTQLAQRVSAALPALDTDSLPSDLQSLLTDTALDADADGGTYVARCVYERPECPPSRRIHVSEPTRPFRLASFFDAEAPSRDINITMPGITMERLRGSPQSVTMHFTKELSKQAEDIQEKAKKGLGADTGKPIDLGRLCSLSIPIITICALVLLLVMVVVLNIVFWWLPFFKICLPLPSSDG